MKILGIESSCDEAGLAVYDSERGVIAEVLRSQVDMHAQYGGVVPELASRDHIRHLLPLLDGIMQEASIHPSELSAIAYTAGPGLLGALLVGACVGRSLAYAWSLPSVPVHHMEGHLLAPLLEPNPPEFPFVALLVSGGHSLLVSVKGIGDYQLLGESLDDAVGEAFDKTAKLLGLGYPGGPVLAKLAGEGRPDRFVFPRPMTDRSGLDFSFSGLKTHAMNIYRSLSSEEQEERQVKADICWAFQEAVVDTLRIKCERALKQTGLSRLVVAGGVSANRRLRDCLQGVERMDVYFPRPSYCTDNGAMIAFAGYHRFQLGEVQDGLEVMARARWGL